MKKTLYFLLCLATLLPLGAYAQEDSLEIIGHIYLAKARVLEALPSATKLVEGTDTYITTQTLTVEVLEGPEKGTIATFENDYTQLKKGDLLFVRHSVGGFDPETWYVADTYRIPVLAIIALAFLALLLLIGGWQGVRALASLLGGIALIIYGLIPGISQGYSPILVSLFVTSVIIVIGSYVTHGFRRTTTIAMTGMLVTVAVTGALTYIVISAAALSGFTTEENAYLNFSTSGRIDMVGLLFGGILIGLLGVLYDIAIGQAIAVEELVRAAAHYTRNEVFARGMRIGREHIGALVNTLAIAYVGASLPLLLFVTEASGDASLLYLINSERFATEIIRILMGSMGLILAVPITTSLAAYILHRRQEQVRGV